MKSLRRRIPPVLAAWSVCLLWFGRPAAVDGAVLHVSLGGNNSATGLTWAAAKRNVTNALAAAAAGDEIWVAQGVYAELIQMKNEVGLYGGFAGTENLRDDRDRGLHPTVLDGAQKGVVVRCEIPFATPATRIDGFIIRNGVGLLGGGIACTASRPTIANNVITNNTSAGPGGGICCYNGADAVIVNNLIAYNAATVGDADGGGIAAMKGDSAGTVGSSPLILGNVIVANRAEENGGGIAAKGAGSAPAILNNFISGNLATQPPLGDRSLGGGGIACVDGGMASLVANNTITANGGLQAGGILLVGGSFDNPPIVNNTIVGNNGPAVCSLGVNNVQLRNNLIAFNSCGLSRSSITPGGPMTLTCNLVFGNAVDYDNLPAATGQNGNLAVDPRLVSVAYGDSHLRADSPCIDSGDATFVGADWTDMDDRARVRGGQVDIGADEFDGTVRSANANIIRVSPAGNDNGTGASWGTAKRTVGAAIQAIIASYLQPQNVIAGGEVWVAAGTYSENLIVPPYVHLFGGFSGNEATRDGRNFTANVSRLDGGGRSNTVFAWGGYQLNTVDGFRVTGGRLTQNLSDQGGGVECYQSGTIIANCWITSNAANLGAGIGAFGGSPTITNCVITNNNAGGDGNGVGGAIQLDHCLALVINCELAHNAASDGGGIYATASKPWIVQNSIHENTGNGVNLQTSSSFSYGPLDLLLVGQNAIYGNVTSDEGGGIYVLYCGGRIVNNLVVLNYSGTAVGGGYGGGMALLCGKAGDGPLLVANNSIVGNTANYFGLNCGGALHTMVFETPNLILANNIVANNSSGIFNAQTSASSPLLVKNDFYANNGLDYQTTGTLGIPGGPLSHPTDLAADPKFVSLASYDFHLQSGSPCVDAGDPANAATADLESHPRPLDGNNDGTSLPDLGAYEYSNPSARGALEFAAPAFCSHLSCGRIDFQVHRLSGLGGAVNVSYASSNGTALAGTHYQATNGVLVFSNGQSTATGSVLLLPGASATNLLYFRVTLSNPTGGAALGPCTVATNYIACPIPGSSNSWGIPDAWVRANGLTLSATSDADHDGFPDRLEWFAGTSPTNAASTFKASIASPAPGGGIAISWTSVPGKRYTLHRSSSLPPVLQLSTLVKTNILADSGVTSYACSSNGPSSFYWVEVEQSP